MSGQLTLEMASEPKPLLPVDNNEVKPTPKQEK